MTRTRAKFVSGIVVVSTLCAIVACTVTVAPDDTITLSNSLFSFSLNVGGIFDLVAGGAPVENKGQIPLFSGLPDDTPESGFISLDAQDIEFIPLLALKGQPTAQVASGTTTLTIKIARGASLDPCAEGVLVGVFILTFIDGTITVDRARLRLPAAAFLHCLTGSFTICLEMQGDINGRIVIDGMGIDFGPPAGGDPGGDPNGSGGCASDAHCSGVEVCENGTCTPAPSGCTTNADCAPGNTCDNGDCVPTAAGCTSHADCASGETCDNGDCVETSAVCTSDGDCASGETCDNGTCMPTTAGCTSDADCAPDETCENGACAPTTAGCTSDTDCAPDETCENGACVPTSGGCILDTDCGSGEVCEAGACVEAPIGCAGDTDCGTDETCVDGVCTPAPTGCVGDDDCGLFETCLDGACKLQVPIAEDGSAILGDTIIDGIEYFLALADNETGVMEAGSPDAPPARWPATIGIDLDALGLASVDTIYYGTLSGWCPDLPDGLTVATLTCSYADGGDPTTVDFVSGSNTAEWSYDREEHTTFLGGVRHARPPELFSYTTSVGSVSSYTGYSYAGSLVLDPERTLTCIELALDPAAPYTSLRDASNVVPTWIAQVMSAITLVGTPGTPGVLGSPCTPEPPVDEGFSTATIIRSGAEHLIAGPLADGTLSLQSPEGYAPGPVGTKSSVLSGDGTKVWVALYDPFPNVEGDPQTQLWSVNTDGTGGVRSSLPVEDISGGMHVTTNIDGSVVVADNPRTATFYRATPGTGVTVLYDYTGIGDPRGIMRITDDASKLIYVNASIRDMAVADISGGTPTPVVFTTIASLITNGVPGSSMNAELDMTSSGDRWIVGTRTFDPAVNRNRWPIFIGDGLSSPTISLVTTERDDLSFSRFHMTDDGQTIAYCRLTEFNGEIGRCYIQSVGSAARTEIVDEVENLGNLSLSDDGSKAYMSTGVGSGGGQGFIYDVATGERYTGGSQWFADSPAPDFTAVEWSDDGRLLMSAITRGIYVLHDGSVPVGFPTIDGILYRMNDEDCSMTVRVEVSAPLGIERIFTLPFYQGLEASRGVIPGEENPLFQDRSGGGVNKSTTFTQVEEGVWERQINLTNDVGECASSLLSSDFSIRIILVEATITRTVFADFVPTE